jgi:hypothetical protein
MPFEMISAKFRADFREKELQKGNSKAKLLSNLLLNNSTSWKSGGRLEKSWKSLIVFFSCCV